MPHGRRAAWGRRSRPLVVIHAAHGRIGRSALGLWPDGSSWAAYEQNETASRIASVLQAASPAGAGAQWHRKTCYATWGARNVGMAMRAATMEKRRTEDARRRSRILVFSIIVDVGPSRPPSVSILGLGDALHVSILVTQFVLAENVENDCTDEEEDNEREEDHVTLSIRINSITSCIIVSLSFIMAISHS